MRWRWWAADFLCLCLVVSAIYHRLPHQQGSNGQKPAGFVNTVSSLDTMPANSENSLPSIETSQSAEKSISSDSKSSTTQREKLTSTANSASVNKESAHKDVVNIPDDSHTPNEIPPLLTELSNYFSTNDMRPAVICLTELMSDRTMSKTPYPYSALGIMLLSSGAAPETVDVLEQSLRLEMQMPLPSRACRYEIYRDMAEAYRRIGKYDKAKTFQKNAYDNADEPITLEMLHSIEKAWGE